MSAPDTTAQPTPIQETALEPPKEETQEAPKTAPAPPSLTPEFNSILPGLVKGGTVVLAKDEIHLPTKSSPGVECQVKPIRTRELLAIGRVLTGTVRPVNLFAIIQPIMSAETASDQNAAVVAAVSNLLITVPHSEEEFIALVQRVVDPVDSAIVKSEAQLRTFYVYLDDPDLLDVVQVFSQVFVNERERLGDLGKALMNMFPQLRREVSP